MPPGRRRVECAKNPSNASPRKKLKPRSSAMLAGDGAVSMDFATTYQRSKNGEQSIGESAQIANKLICARAQQGDRREARDQSSSSISFAFFCLIWSIVHCLSALSG